MARVSAQLASSLHKRSATNGEAKSREKAKIRVQREERGEKGKGELRRGGSSLHKAGLLKPSPSQYLKGEKGKENY
jgi:hypothetical protein